MSRIQKTFQNCHEKGRKAFITFVTGGDPNLEESLKILHTLDKAGVDIIELGMPFSDPMADGPVIQLANERALKAGTSLEKILHLVADFRKSSQTPVVLMGYFNPIFHMGIDRFIQKASQSGVDGVLVVDLPYEEAKDFSKALQKEEMDFIYLITPTTPPDRIRKISQRGSGFLYYVSMTGITGKSLKISSEISEQIKKIRKESDLPVAIGFGISEPEQAKKLASLADGVVIGSSIVKIIEKQGAKLHQNLHIYLSSLREVL